MRTKTTKDNVDALALSLSKNPEDFDVWKAMALAEDAREAERCNTKYVRVYTHKNGKPRITKLKELQKKAPKNRPKVFRVGQEVTFRYGLKQEVIYTGKITRKDTDPKQYYVEVEGYPATLVFGHNELIRREV